jgi:hypothetical protein
MSERCSYCILPVNLPGLTLNHDGKCNYCRNFETGHINKVCPQHDDVKGRFDAIIEQLRGKGKYDCLVPLSGGKESSYILYVLVKEFDLRPLAFNVNNGFQHVDAVRNIEHLVGELGVDLVIYRPNQQLLRTLMRAFLSKAGEFCTPCNMLISATSFRLARQNRIKAIMYGNVMGTNPGLEGVSPALHYDRRYYLNIADGLLGRTDRDYYINPPYVRTAIRRLLGTEAQVINVLDYLRPTLQEIHDRLESVGWKRPAGEIQHGDCLLNPLKDHLMCRRWGCSELTAMYSVLVRNGEMNREEALKRAAAEEHTAVPPVLPEFLKAIGMTESEFNKASKKDFRDVPNMRKSLLFRCAKKVIEKVERLRGRR